MDDLAESFSAVIGKQPTEAARQRLYRLKDSLGLKENDALWSILFALESYQELYEDVPDQITAKTHALLREFKDTAEAIAKASAEASQRRVSEAFISSMTKVIKDVTEKPRAIASRRLMQWATVAVVTLFLSAAGLSIWMHRLGRAEGYAEGSAVGYKQARQKEDEAGFVRGRVAGYEDAKSEKAAAAWANTSEGKLAQELAKAGSLHTLARCTGKGWKVQKGFCYPLSEGGKVEGWRLPEEPRKPVDPSAEESDWRPTR